MSGHYPKITNASDFGKVAVLLGGTSAEREISLLTGEAVLAALKERGVDAHRVDAIGNFWQELIAARYDRVWIALHGRGGEDGTVQGLLEYLGIPYTGSGVLGSALAMDKVRTKQILQASGLPTPAWVTPASSAELSAAAATLGLPLIVKPALEGSSIGMTRVEHAAQLEAAWQTARAADATVLAESCVTGGEYTAAILKDTVLPIIRIEVAGTFYDYQAKYFSDETRYHCPCDLSPDEEQHMAQLALRAFRAVGARGWGRVDFMRDAATGQPLILEVNTVPGMTSHSLVPMAAEAAGIDFGGLVWRILETAFVAEAAAGGASDAA